MPPTVHRLLAAHDLAALIASIDSSVRATLRRRARRQRYVRRLSGGGSPGGWWAAIWNVFGDDSRPDPFHEATKALLQGPSSPGEGERGVPFALDEGARVAAINRTGAFDVVESLTSRWSLVLDPEQTVALYGTYSNINVRPDRD